MGEPRIVREGAGHLLTQVPAEGRPALYPQLIIRPLFTLCGQRVSAFGYPSPQLDQRRLLADQR